MSNQTQKKEGPYAQLTGFRRAIPIILVALAVFSGLCFIMQDTGTLGRAISNALLGLFSIGGYFIPAFLAIHAVFYPSDVQKKRVYSRIIFTFLAVITISALTHTLSMIGEEITFNGAEFYKNGTECRGGGFIGGLIAFALTHLFGKVGLIIIALLMFALYITYFLAGGKTVFSRILLKILNGISAFFGSFDERKKKKKEKKAERRELRRREELAESQELLTDDEFFEADNGMKELTISELGIREVRDDADIERNPHLQNTVFHKSEVTPDSHEPCDTATEGRDEPARRRRVNLDYSTFDSMHGLSVSVDDSVYEPRSDDIIYSATQTNHSSADTHRENRADTDARADDMFAGGFDSFDVRINEALSNKPSSKAPRIQENEPVSELVTPISEITEQDVENARRRADFEMKKRAAIEAQKRYKASQAEIARAKALAEAERAAASGTSEDIPYSFGTDARHENTSGSYTNVSPDNATFEFEARESDEEAKPYIPEYMVKDEEVAEEETAASEAEERDSAEAYRRAASFANAISDYEADRRSEFKPFGYSETDETASVEPEQISEPQEELTASRSMLDPMPPLTDDIPDSEEGFTFEVGESDIPNEIFGSSEYTFETDADEEEEATTDLSPEEIPTEDSPSDDEEIPEELQNPDVLMQRRHFSFLNTDDGVGDGDRQTEQSTDALFNDIAEQDNYENEPENENREVLEQEPKRPSLFAERMLNRTPAQPKSEPEPKPIAEKPDYSDYQYPPVDLLTKGKPEEDLNQEEEKNQNAEKLVDALQQFNVRISIKGIDRGPRITRYEIVPARGVKVNSVTNLFNDIQLNLGVEGMRMEAPIPGKSAIGVEIPNKKPSTVLLRDLVESDEFISASSKTMSCLGKDVTGNPVFADIAKMPHVLVAGATGMGKSVCINSILISILYKARPDEVKFIMIDPKKVEFNGYNGIPHLLVPVVTDVKQAAGALMWAVEQMEKRYDLMEALEVRKLDSYNEKVRENPSLGEPLPKIVIVIDELNDIMLQVRKPAEDLIMSIAQKARAAGIHLIIGTQRPSVDVITGVIKANIPSRISCKVASFNDSKTILEQAGAEKLLNNGDMLYIPAGAPKALRVQGAFVSDNEVSAIMKFLKSQAKGQVYDEQALEEINRAAQKCSKGKGGSDDFDDDDDDDGDNVGILNDQQFLDAVDLAIKSGKISTSLIQRKISVGYGKAAKFIDYMVDMGIVSEPNGQKPREVLITRDEWSEMLSRRSLD